MKREARPIRRPLSDSDRDKYRRLRAELDQERDAIVAQGRKFKAARAATADADKKAHKIMAMQADLKIKMDAMSDADKATNMKMTKGTMMKMEGACKGHDTMTMTDVMKAMK